MSFKFLGSGIHLGESYSPVVDSNRPLFTSEQRDATEMHFMAAIVNSLGFFLSSKTTRGAGNFVFGKLFRVRLRAHN